MPGFAYMLADVCILCACAGMTAAGFCQGHLSAHRIPASILAKAGMRGDRFKWQC
jgi:hypothetical protein